MGQMEHVCVTSYCEGRSLHCSMNTACVTLQQNSMPSLLLDHRTGLQEAQAEGRGVVYEGSRNEKGPGQWQAVRVWAGGTTESCAVGLGGGWSLQTAVPHLSEAAEGARDQQLLTRNRYRPWLSFSP